jgi:hypothetical protein
MIYRYCCPNCLRTFLDNIKDDERFCWKCGQKLTYVPHDEKFDYKKLSDEFYNNCITKNDVLNCEEENGAIKVLDMFAEFLNQKLGTRTLIDN